MKKKTEDGAPALLHVALFRPEIHPNAGNIARLCAANSLPLYLVGAIGFRIDDKSIRRAGLDYWPHVDLHTVASLEALQAMLPDSRFFYFSARAKHSYASMAFKEGDCMVFGPESTGLPEEILLENSRNALKIPMRSAHVRSLNLATAVGIAVYEALRQLGEAGARQPSDAR